MPSHIFEKCRELLESALEQAEQGEALPESFFTELRKLSAGISPNEFLQLLRDTDCIDSEIMRESPEIITMNTSDIVEWFKQQFEVEDVLAQKLLSDGYGEGWYDFNEAASGNMPEEIRREFLCLYLRAHRLLNDDHIPSPLLLQKLTAFQDALCEEEDFSCAVLLNKKLNVPFSMDPASLLQKRIERKEGLLERIAKMKAEQRCVPLPSFPVSILSH